MICIPTDSTVNWKYISSIYWLVGKLRTDGIYYVKFYFLSARSLHASETYTSLTILNDSEVITVRSTILFS